MMKIILNGVQQICDASLSISALLSAQGYDGKVVAVALNGVFVPKSSYEAQELKEGDDVEIVAPMQGG